MSQPTTLIAFVTALSVTVAMLTVAVALAKCHRVRAHIGAVVCFFVCLLVTLVLADRLGRSYSFEPVSFRIHMTLAWVTTGASLLPVLTGIRHHRRRGSLVSHRRAVGLFLALVLVTLGTGTWMLRSADLREAAPSEVP